ncbi:MAG: hypothetical protein FWG36_09350 [Oscillospiraceae bacterium]|nr:hypothetical protein [Oscillospiraceae bacterium]
MPSEVENFQFFFVRLRVASHQNETPDNSMMMSIFINSATRSLNWSAVSV